METQAARVVEQRAGARSAALLKRGAAACAVGLLIGLVMVPKPVRIGPFGVREARLVDGDVAHGRIRIFNAGLLPLLVRTLSGGHCAACAGGATTPPVQERIWPLTTASVNIEMHTGDKTGHVSGQVQIRTNSPVRPSLNVPYELDVRKLLEVTPAALAVTATSGAASKSSITISNVFDEPLTVERAFLDVNPGLSADVEGLPITLSPGAAGQLRLKVAPTSDVGAYGGGLVLIVDRRSDPYQVPLTATVTGPARLDRDAVVIDQGDQTTDRQEVHVQRLPGGPMPEILKYRSSSPSVCVAELPRTEGCGLAITYSGPVSTGAASITTSEVSVQVRLGDATSFLRVPVFVISHGRAEARS